MKTLQIPLLHPHMPLHRPHMPLHSTDISLHQPRRKLAKLKLVFRIISYCIIIIVTGESIA
jgi:hypothetical protein